MLAIELIPVAIEALMAALLLGLLVYQSLWLVQHVLVPTLRRLPVVGGWIAGHVNDLAIELKREMNQLAQIGLSPLTHALHRLGVRSSERSNVSLHVFQVTFNALHHLRWELLPALRIEAYGWVQAALTYTNARAAQLAAYAQQLVTQARQEARQLFGLSIQHTDQVASLLEALDRARALAVQDYARQLTEMAITRADAEVERAIRAAALEDAAVASYAQDLAGKVATYAQGLNLDTRRVTELGFAQDRQQLALTAGAILAQVATMGAGLGGRIRNIENSSCQQQCEPLGKLGQELRALDLLLLIALVAACVAKPQESARIVAAGLGPVSDEVVQLTDRLIGVR